MDGLDLLGAEPIKPPPMSWKRGALALAAGAISAVLVPKHPVLAFLGGAAVASNTHAVVVGDRPLTAALRRMGRHVVATVGSLSIQKHPALGYVAGAVAADLLIDGEGGGIIEEWSEYEGVRDIPRGKIIDAEYTEVKPATKALVKS